jgi:hypothetical protein
MQQIGRDRIHRSFTDGTSILNELCTGNFIFGAGDETQIVDSMDQVKTFDPSVQQLVQAWLDSGGVHRAQKEKRELLMAEQAAKAPGTVDALLDRLNDPELKGQVVAMLTEMIRKAEAKAPTPDVVAQADHGVVVKRADGGREFIPDDADLDDVIAREEALSAKEEGGDQVSVGVGAEGEADTGSVHDEIHAATRASTKAALRQAGGKPKARK